LFGGGGGGVALGDDRDEEGQSLDEAPNLRLDLRDQPARHEPAGLCRDGPDQGYHGMAEALRRGKDWDVVHALFLAHIAAAGQAENDMFRTWQAFWSPQLGFLCGTTHHPGPLPQGRAIAYAQSVLT